MPPTIKATTVVQADLTFDSSTVGPPFWFSRATGLITFEDGSAQHVGNWKPEKVGSPVGAGAAFILNLIDANGSAIPGDILSWAVTFIPRGTTTSPSPFGTQSAISDKGARSKDGLINLNFDRYKIKREGSWDWTLMVQIKIGEAVCCFVSDPQMDVDPTQEVPVPKRRSRPRAKAR